MLNQTQQSVRDIIVKNIGVVESDLEKPNFLIIYDTQSLLARQLFEAYSAVLTAARSVDYYAQDPENVKALLPEFKAGDLVVLIQSTSFRMSNFRWRLELFNLGFKVIEHAHLGVNKDDEAQNYLDTLVYQGDFYKKNADYLKPLIESAKEILVECFGGTRLIYKGGMEEVKKNIGDFTGLRNVGCGFPIGEVFSEPLDFEQVNGEMMIYAFANKEHRVVFAERPFKLRVEKGCVYGDGDVPVEFEEVLAMVQTENPDGLVRVREFGLGMNKGISKMKRLTDVSAFERVCGMHVSLGMKHDIYRSKIDKKKVQRFHVDIFPDLERVIVDGVVIFEGGGYVEAEIRTS